MGVALCYLTPCGVCSSVALLQTDIVNPAQAVVSGLVSGRQWMAKETPPTKALCIKLAWFFFSPCFVWEVDVGLFALIQCIVIFVLESSLIRGGKVFVWDIVSRVFQCHCRVNTLQLIQQLFILFFFCSCLLQRLFLYSRRCIII